MIRLYLRDIICHEAVVVFIVIQCSHCGSENSCFAEKDSQTGSFHHYPVKLSYCGKSYCDLQMLEGLPHLMGSKDQYEKI